jgi:FtsZ-binding cell division protein ZapB
MKRNFLESFDLDKAAIDAIMAENGKDIEAAKSDIDSLKLEVDELTKTVKERDDQLKTLEKAAGDNESLSQQIKDLREENRTAAEKYKGELTKLQMDGLLESKLRDVKAKNIKAVKALLDADKLKIENGELIGLKEQLDALTVDESTKFLFGETNIEGIKPAPSAPPKPEEPKTLRDAIRVALGRE